MVIPRYLAMTPGEMARSPCLPQKCAYLACHFSPYGPGLSNLPKALPEGSLLILDDITPMAGHDPQCIARQLAQCVQAFSCDAVLLDFQRPGNAQAAALAEYLSQALPCPAVVSELYGKELTCPIFLPPLPLATGLSEHLLPYRDREIWLDLSAAGEVITLTSAGATVLPLPLKALPEVFFPEEALHCRYHIEVTDTAAIFSLWRSQEDLDTLLAEAAELGVTAAAGLWQELSAPQNA